MRKRFAFVVVGFSLALFFGMLLFLELGWRLGLQQSEILGDAARSGVGLVDGAIYGLLALLLGFTFNGAMARFDRRRDLIINEASTIKTAWQRIDTLPPETQPAIREGLRQYLEALLGSYDKNPDAPGALRASAIQLQSQNDIWARSVAACLEPEGEKARMLLLPSLNEMFVAVGKEHMAWRIHPPVATYLMLALAALASALFAGYAMASEPTRNWLFFMAVPAMVAVVMYVILDIEFPRVGLIRVNAMDQVLVDVRASMNEDQGLSGKLTMSRDQAAD